MGKKLPYFPAREADQVAWLTNYRAKISTHGPTCGILPAEVTATLADIDAYLYTLNWHITLQADLQEGTAFKRNLGYGEGAVTPLPTATVLGSPPPPVAPGVIVRMQGQVQRIKNHPAYTLAIGQDLQAIGSDDTAAHSTPEFTLTPEEASPNQSVVLKFKKFGHEGVYIECRRPLVNQSWTFLKIATRAPYVDVQGLQSGPPTETREYRMRFWDAGEANGPWSAVQSVVVR